jgi:hypothetical protein
MELWNHKATLGNSDDKRAQLKQNDTHAVPRGVSTAMICKDKQDKPDQQKTTSVMNMVELINQPLLKTTVRKC